MPLSCLLKFVNQHQAILFPHWSFWLHQGINMHFHFSSSLLYRFFLLVSLCSFSQFIFTWGEHRFLICLQWCSSSFIYQFCPHRLRSSLNSTKANLPAQKRSVLSCLRLQRAIVITLRLVVSLVAFQFSWSIYALNALLFAALIVFSSLLDLVHMHIEH